MFDSLYYAYNHNKKSSTLRGGSTISQQTAKNCFLPHSRTLLRKVVEAYYVLLIELLWGKKRIMECYLNIIEFGDGIYGCEAAAQHYFHHSAEHLTRREAALLAACLPSPLKMNPGRPGPYLNRQASVVQGRKATYGRINLDARREDLNHKYLKQMDEGLLDFLWWVISDGESLKPKKK
jgi:monofunctional biosynthetic peptidoglycan transglycosylase